ncbi:hypothetical protein Glove_341g40 [Diversispora epigaea]|uniref:Protein kinase domain-containing protein n=1 Tax=Diversispora epigaea TaxID=1348612 RepID=A0A397HGH8_9GLOM|nr:hypothetical protein Glove_341g40 [Diversispora epigaea]
MNSQIVDKTLFSKESEHSEFLIWDPYEKFTNAEYIAKGGFNEIYKAIWENKREKGILETVKTEVLNDSNVDTIKELKYTYQIWDEIEILQSRFSRPATIEPRKSQIYGCSDQVNNA